MPINYVDISAGIVGFTEKNYKTQQHRHFHIEVAFALNGYLNVKTTDEEYNNIESIVINSNQIHSFDCMAGECQLYFFDPLSSIGNNLLKEYFVGDENVRVNSFSCLQYFKNHYLGINNNQKISERDIDDRVNICLEWLETNFSIEGINVAKVSEVALLSDSRLAHIFKEQTGISVHQYILWKKVEEAMLLSQEGFSLTQCAHALGFTDSSHFNRTFKNMFGISPYFALKK